jgi:hypothetical protein
LLGQVGDFADGLIHRIGYLYYMGSTVVLLAITLPRIAGMGHPAEEDNGASRILSTWVNYVGVIDKAKNLAASEKMRGFFASLRMTSIGCGVLEVRGPFSPGR